MAKNAEMALLSLLFADSCILYPKEEENSFRFSYSGIESMENRVPLSGNAEASAVRTHFVYFPKSWVSRSREGVDGVL